VGYEVPSLVSQIGSALGINAPLAIVIVGMGNLGMALAHYQGFADRGLTLRGLYDTDARKIGQRVGGIAISHPDGLRRDVAESGVCIGVIATPAHAAKRVADLLVEAGVTSILNFAPVVLRVPDGVTVRRVDVATELLILGFHESKSG
jgi:redox-sensing transcriptional repressor